MRLLPLSHNQHTYHGVGASRTFGNAKAMLGSGNHLSIGTVVLSGRKTCSDKRAH